MRTRDEGLRPTPTRNRSPRSIARVQPPPLDPIRVTSAARVSVGGPVYPPPVRDTLQLVLAGVLENDPRAGREISHRLRTEHLRRPREPADPRPDHDRQSAGLAIDRLDLAGVHTGADLDPERAHRPDDRLRAAHRAAGQIGRAHV